VSPGQRTHGSASLQVRISLALPKRLRAHTREITKVHTPASMQGNGLASALMREVCAEADEAGMTLMLWPRPYGDDVALSASMLCDWYAGFGFRVIQPEPVLMARAPGLYTRLAPVTAACEELGAGSGAHPPALRTVEGTAGAHLPVRSFWHDTAEAVAHG
jgi:predicted GNAT family acetyltransferase